MVSRRSSAGQSPTTRGKAVNHVAYRFDAYAQCPVAAARVVGVSALDKRCAEAHVVGAVYDVLLAKRAAVVRVPAVLREVIVFLAAVAHARIRLALRCVDAPPHHAARTMPCGG